MTIPVFNKEKTIEAFGGDEEILFSVSLAFVDELPGELSKLKLAIDECDLDTIRISVHTLKGQAGTFYAEEAKIMAAELEAFSKDSELEAIKEKIEDFEKAFLDLKAEVTKMLNNRDQ